jgi:hypothetical protein
MNLNNEYWNDYYHFWDEWCENWFKARGNDNNAIIEEQNNVFYNLKDKGNLDLNELPEPYLGKPSEGVDAVFLNLNPGMSAKNENSKFYSCKDTSDPSDTPEWLIREFINCNYKYSDYLTKWSPLNPDLRGHDPEVCGVRWWQGTNPNSIGGRMSWVRRIYGNNNICPSRVFALELCPYHSKKWNLALNNDQMKDFIINNVFIPAFTAVYENKLPYAIAIGRSIDLLLNDPYVQNKLKFHHLASWTEKNNNNIEWPCNKDSKPINRTFNLYTFNLFGSNVNILVTYAPGGNTTPAISFSQIEDNIRTYVNENK